MSTCLFIEVRVLNVGTIFLRLAARENNVYVHDFTDAGKFLKIFFTACPWGSVPTIIFIIFPI